MSIFRKKESNSTDKKRYAFFNEKGNILVWYVFMIPIFIGGIGLAVDVANMSAVKSSLQVSLDAATQGTVALSKNQSKGKPRFSTSSAAQAQAVRLYDTNRSGMSKAGYQKEGIPFLMCQKSKTGEGKLVIPSGSKCGFTLSSFSYNPNGGLKNGGYVTMTVSEKADTIFLQALGFDDLTYTVTSTARLTNTYN